MKVQLARLGAVMGLCSMLLVGCRAAPDDPEGQAEELSNSVRRENAIFNLQKIYAGTLADNKGDRSAQPVQELANVIVGPLTDAYMNNPEDTQNRLGILNLLQEVRDPRSLPALLDALKWRQEVTEEHAIRAAQTLQSIDIPPGDKGKVIAALDSALSKISGNRPQDNKMRVSMIQALGSTGDKSATKILTRIATAQDENQPFLINRLAVQQVGELGDTSAIPDLVRSLFLFAPGNPGMRMSDVAAEALVRLGKPSLKPLLKVLRGKDGEANKIAKRYIAAIKAKRPDIASQMSVRQVTSAESSFALGALGFPDAIAPLMAEANNDDPARRLNGAIALVRLNGTAEQRAQIRKTVKEAYGKMPKGEVGLKGQLLAALAHTYESDVMPFIKEQMSNRKNHPTLRLIAAQNYALLAGADEARGMQAMIKSEPKSENGGYREKFAEHSATLKLATECATKLSCWIDKLKSPDLNTARKSAYMVGRYGKDKKPAIDALVDKLGHEDLGVRLAALLALDRTATKGSKAAVDKIDALREVEQGRTVWTGFAREALPIQARLRSRLKS